MQNIIDKTNTVYITGDIEGTPQFSYEEYGEKFYLMTVKIPRLSGNADYLPVTISERLMNSEMLSSGRICALGQFRSYNKLENGRTRLMLTVFVRELVESAPTKNPNSIVLSGYICKPPVYRTTPFNREIADLLIAVNRAYNKSDYIPCIAWGRNARFVQNLRVGDKVALSGRIQSREYQKATDNGIEARIAYEASIAWISVVKSDEEMNDAVKKYL